MANERISVLLPAVDDTLNKGFLAGVYKRFLRQRDQFACEAHGNERGAVEKGAA